VENQSSTDIEYTIEYNKIGLSENGDNESNDSTDARGASGVVSANDADLYTIDFDMELRRVEATVKNSTDDATLLIDQDANLGSQQDGLVTIYESGSDDRVNYEFHGSPNTTFRGSSKSLETFDDGTRNSSRSDSDQVAYGFVKSNSDIWDMEGQFSAIILDMKDGAEAIVDRSI
jgi:hypothetical protein